VRAVVLAAAGAALALGAAAGFSAGRAVAGRHPAAAPKPRRTTVTVTLVDFRIRLSRTSVPVGTVVFHVTNRGATVHDLVFPGHGRTRLLRPGQKQTIVIRFGKKGLYRYLCSVPGHAELGMKGVLGVGRSARSSPGPPATTPTATAGLTLSLVAQGFGPLTYVTAPPDDPDRLLAVQQDGLVVLLKDGVRQAAPFLDLRDRVRADGEKGLLSLAFAPDYATSGLLYVDYNDVQGNLHVVEYHRSAASDDAADPGSARQVLEIDKPTADHNGGMLQFGPDGDLYVAVGDGGADPPSIPVGAYGQTLDDLLGSILRIDPRHGDPYAIPPGNPLVGTPGARPEIVAYGLRNPWRFWIDPATNAMLIGDVGEGTREEIDRLPLDRLGLNFGWPCKEGTTTPPAAIPKPAACATAMLTPPLFEYAHSQSRCSIIGGPVARDPRLPGLAGLYLWTDLCDTHLYAIDPSLAHPAEIDLKLGAAQPTSFGTDALGRVYLTTLDGKLYRLDPTTSASRNVIPEALAASA
jgi:glucose/arabinose dehydrogenase